MLLNILLIAFLYFLFQVTFSLNTHKSKSGSLTKITTTKSRVQEVLKKTCPNNGRLIPNHDYVKSSNGCGPEGNEWLLSAGKILVLSSNDAVTVMIFALTLAI